MNQMLDSIYIQGIVFLAKKIRGREVELTATTLTNDDDIVCKKAKPMVIKKPSNKSKP